MIEARDPGTEVAASIALMCVGVATAVMFARVFDGWSFVPAATIAVVATHLVATTLRALRTPGWLAAPVTLTLMAWVLAALHHADTLQAGVPTKATFDALRSDLAAVVAEFPTAVAPVASDGHFATAAGVALVGAALLADLFAFRALGQVEAVIPPAAVMVVVSAVGTDRLRLPLAVVWAVAALTAIGLLRHRARMTDLPWLGRRRLGVLPAIVGILLTVAAAVGTAVVVGPRLPGAGAAPLVDTRTQVPGVTEVVSPLVDIRSRLTDQSTAEMFTVSSPDGPHYWRLLSLPVFDGSAWQPPEEDLVDEIDGTVEGRPSRATMTIAGLGGPLVPAPYRPVRTDDDEVLWAGDSESLVRTGGGLERGDVVTVDAVVPAPEPDGLRGSTWVDPPGPTYVSIPAGLPPSLVDGLIESGATATTNAYDAAIAVQTWFRTVFVYDTAIDLTDSADAIDEFLNIRRGFCQQFAGTFAVMMRMLGVPARVAVGFTPGDSVGEGRYRVLGRHAHAWPEVWFDGVGWVSFEPTPGRGSPDAVGYLGIPAAQDPGSSAPPTTTADTTPATTVPPTTETAPIPTGPPLTVPAAPTVRGSASTGTSLVSVGLVVGAALVLWALTAPHAVGAIAHRRRRRWTPRQRIVASWHRAVRSIELLGAAPTHLDTPLDVVASVTRAGDLDPSGVSELAVIVSRAVFGADPPSELEAVRCEALGDEIALHCHERSSTARRLRCRFRPWTLHPSGVPRDGASTGAQSTSR